MCLLVVGSITCQATHIILQSVYSDHNYKTISVVVVLSPVEAGDEGCTASVRLDSGHSSAVS